jgi:hypothetical protein
MTTAEIEARGAKFARFCRAFPAGARIERGGGFVLPADWRTGPQLLAAALCKNFAVLRDDDIPMGSGARLYQDVDTRTEKQKESEWT